MKSNNRLVIIALLPILLSACNNTRKPTPSGPTFVEDRAPFYTDTYSSAVGGFIKSKVTDFTYAYWSDKTLIIYMTLDTALNYLFENNVTKTIEGNVATYTCPDDLVFIVDSDKDTIVAHNYDEINLFSKTYDSKFGVIDSATAAKYVIDNNSTYIGGEDVTFNLADYCMDIYRHNDDFYIPYNVVNTLTLNYALWSSVNFNGSGFYYLDLLSGAFSLDYAAYGNNSYVLDYYRGPYRKYGGRDDKTFVEHNFNSFMFQLDTFYGFRDEKMVPFADYLSENYPEIIEQLKSSDEQDYCRGVERIMEEVIGDGHTNAGNASSAFSTGTYNKGRYTSARSQKLGQDYYTCASNRILSLGKNPTGLRFTDSGKTAILTFDGFYHAGVTLTTSNIAKYVNDDGFALFYDAFNKIKKKSTIENVIFDITCNGGGDTNALIPMLGFLNDSVDLTMYSPLTKLTAKLSYKVDTNLDGVYDSSDNYKGKYNFYVLTSNYSFSCANLFPQICQEMGSAKIIGQQSGGGACVVYYTATPDGKPYRISSNMRDGQPEDSTKHRDAGIPVDYEIDPQYFYDDNYLDNFVTSL